MNKHTIAALLVATAFFAPAFASQDKPTKTADTTTTTSAKVLPKPEAQKDGTSKTCHKNAMSAEEKPVVKKKHHRKHHRKAHHKAHKAEKVFTPPAE